MDNIQNKKLATPKRLAEYESYLRREERSENTVAKYVRDLRSFFVFLSGREMAKELVMEWKEKLTDAYAPASVNSMLAAVNGFLIWAGLEEYKVKPLKIQREIFSKPEKELTKEEYFRLIDAAQRGRSQRLSLLLQTICSTGIRVSELRYITAEALQTRRAVVDNKGKTRIVFLPLRLCRLLSRYCREHGIRTGTVFCTKSGKPLDRSNIWREMKALCKSAGVDAGKVFPHNLRRLFARTYYRMEKDLSRLADILGHTSIATTRIYTMESGQEHARQLDLMGLLPLRR